MKYGITAFTDDAGVSIEVLARAAEDSGFESLFVTEHTHHPAASVLPDGSAVPDELAHHFLHCLDPFVALTAAACATSEIKLGTGICLLPQHDTIAVAKTTATLDWISGGRFIFGVAAGWNAVEANNHGVEPSTRWQRMAEQIEAIKAIWTQPVASYAGRHVSFEGVQAYPKPLQDPHPEVLIGGDSVGNRRRAHDMATGWMPTHDRSGPDLHDNIKALVKKGRQTGRNTTVTVSYVPPEPSLLTTYAELGASRLVFLVPTDSEAALGEALTACTSAMRQADLG